MRGRVAVILSVSLWAGCGTPEVAPGERKRHGREGGPVAQSLSDGGVTDVLPVEPLPAVDGGVPTTEPADAGPDATDGGAAGPDAGTPHEHPDTKIPFGFLEPAECVGGTPYAGHKYPHPCIETDHLGDGSAALSTHRDGKGRIVRTVVDRSDAPDDVTIRQYDDAGRLVLVDSDNWGGWETRRWKYSDTGVLLERSYSGADDFGGFYSRTVYLYEDGRLVRVDSYDARSAPPYHVARHRYDDAGFNFRIDYEVAGENQSFQTRSYDPASRTLRLRTERPGEIIHELFEYDEAGRTLSHFKNDPWIRDRWTYHPNGTVASETIERDLGAVTLRSFDERGRLTSEQWGGSQTTHRYEDAGLVETNGRFSGDSGEQTSRRVLQYDAGGRLQLAWALRDWFSSLDEGCWHARSAEKRTYSCDGELLLVETTASLPEGIERVEYERDAAGNLVRETSFDAHGVKTRWKEYSYEGCFDAPQGD